MGKLLVTNHAPWFEELHAIFEQSGFRLSEKALMGQAMLSAYKKLNFENENFVQFSDGFISCAGTLLYKGNTGADALRAIYLDLEKESIKKIRKRLYGCFAVAVCKKQALQIFVDEMAEYCLYYTIADGKYLITSTYYHIQNCLHSQLNGDGLLSSAVRGGLIDNQTPFVNIYKLRADEALCIDVQNGECKIDAIELNQYQFEFESPEKAIAKIKKIVDEIAGERAKAFRNALQFLTGGIDSRLELAIHKYAGANIASACWSGEDIITNGTQLDSSISRQIADYVGIEHMQYDVTEEFEDALRNIDRKKCLKYGEYASKYTCNSRWFSILENNHQFEYVGFGFFVDGMRELGEIDRHYRRPYALSDFVRDVYSRVGVEKYAVKSGTFYDFLEKMFLERNSGLNPKDVSKDECFHMFTKERINPDGAMDNLCNMFCHGFSIFAQKKVFDAMAAMPYLWHKDEMLPLMMTKQYDPNLLDIPYCPHHHLMRIHRETLKPAASFKVKGHIREMIMKSPLYRLLYLNKIQKLVKPKTKANQKIMELCMHNLEASSTMQESHLQVQHYYSTNGIEISSFASFVALVKALDTLFLNQEIDYADYKIKDRRNSGVDLSDAVLP